MAASGFTPITLSSLKSIEILEEQLKTYQATLANAMAKTTDHVLSGKSTFTMETGWYGTGASGVSGYAISELSKATLPQPMVYYCELCSKSEDHNCEAQGRFMDFSAPVINDDDHEVYYCDDCGEYEVDCEGELCGYCMEDLQEHDYEEEDEIEEEEIANKG